MRILHLISGDLTGGAARGAYWLHLALKELGVDSKIITNSKNTMNDDSVINITQNTKKKILDKIRMRLDSLPTKFYKNRKKYNYSTGIIGFNFTKIKEYQEADIIHMHWINGGFVNIKHLAKLDKPIIWTVRDMWPMTGGCHYAMDCENYKTGCGNCGQLNSHNKNDLSRFVLQRKIKYLPKSMKVVGISHWLSDKAKESKLFSCFDIRTISNNVNTKEFFPIDKKTAKKILNIKTEKRIILTGFTNAKDFYKGFDKFLEAVSSLDKDKYFLCFFGNLDKSITDRLDFEYKSFGYLYDSVSLGLVYSSADVFVAPSLMDAFCKTLAESMACGTPAVCFDATGPKDIVTHKVDGYKAIPYQSSDLANGIEWVLNAENYDELCHNAREKVLREFDSKVIANRYMELYREVLRKDAI